MPTNPYESPRIPEEDANVGPAEPRRFLRLTLAEWIVLSLLIVFLISLMQPAYQSPGRRRSTAPAPESDVTAEPKPER